MNTKIKFYISSIAISAALITFFATCKKEKQEATPVPTPVVKMGTVTGKVHSPTGVPIGSAEVISGIYSTKTTGKGDFTLNLAAGHIPLVIQSGSGHIFKTSMTIDVGENQSLALPYASTLLVQTVPMAYIPGDYDQIETVVIDSLGYNAVPITTNDLDNLTTLNSYGALFINCSSYPPLDSLKYTNLGTYLAGGGSLYASDFALYFLTGDGNWRIVNQQYVQNFKNSSHESGNSPLSTCTNPMLGGFINDSSLCASRTGQTGIFHHVDIYDTDIINLLGKDSIDIYYDLGGWEVISIADAPFTVLMADNTSAYQYGPLAVKTDLNGSETNGGIIFYTTFHTNPQGTVSSDVKQILEYFILNL